MDKTSVLKDDYMCVDYFGYLYRNDKYSIDTISNQVKLFLAFQSILKSETDEKVVVTQTDLENELKEIFGSQVVFEHESILANRCAFPHVTYDEEKGIYTLPHRGGGGGVGTPRITSKVESAKEYSDRLEIVEMIAYIEFEVSDDYRLIPQVYKTVKDEIVIGTLEVDEKIEDVFTKYDSELNRYRYTYRKENNAYYLDSVELVK